MRIRSSSFVVTVALIGAALAGCGGGESTAATAEPAQAAPKAAPQVEAPKPAEPAKPSVEDTSFRLALESDKQYAAGQPGTVHLVLEARGGYHVNQEYPIRVDLKAPGGVKLTKTSLAKPDAAAFGEKSARFDVGFTADKGAHDLAATVDFAVCTAETCVPDQRTVAIALDVQ